MSFFIFSILSTNNHTNNIKINDVQTPSECTVELEKAFVKLEPKTEWKSIYLNFLINFLTAMQFNLFFSSLWSFMKKLDSSISESYFSVVISTYSVAQIIASPLLGYWSNTIGQIKIPLIVCLLFGVIGNLIYFLVEIIPFNQMHTIFVARFITGIGSTTIGLTKTYAVAASIPKDRMRAIAFATGGMALGTTFGPGIQLFFTSLNYPGIQISAGFSIHMFNAPALHCCISNIIVIIMVYFFFNESFVGVVTKKVKKSKKKSDSSTEIKLPKYNRFAIFTCFIIRFTQMFIITNIETIGSPFFMMMFSWSLTDVVFYISIFQVARGFLAFIIYFGYIAFDIGKFINERIACFCCLVGLLLFHFITFSWPFLPENVDIYNKTEISEKELQNYFGCNIAKYEWCSSLKKINLYVFFISLVVIVGTAFSNINVTLNSLFSRILGPRLQGTQQGLLEMSGSLAKIFGPLIVGFLYTQQGPRPVWILEIVVILIGLIIWIVAYKQLVPLKI